MGVGPVYNGDEILFSYRVLVIAIDFRLFPCIAVSCSLLIVTISVYSLDDTQGSEYYLRFEVRCMARDINRNKELNT